jgi:7-cyano-7-deazaguanine synthase in queuosine biosynthesis
VRVVIDYTPHFRVWYSQGECGQPRELLDGRDFRLHARHVCHFFGCNFPPRLVDLLRVAMSVYVIDRRTKRKAPDVPDGWSRSFRVRLEVLDPEFWEATASHALTRCVEFVTGDRWDFEFVRDEAGPRPLDVARSLFPLEEEDSPATVALYSGGLDSAAGLACRLMEQPGRRFLPVTVTHQSQQPGNVQAQLSLLRRRLGEPLSHLMVQAEMVQSARSEEEKSQRCRAFLFACVGGAVAALNGSVEVEVYESGVGAVNVPLYDWMVGSRATKSSHPHFLQLASRLVSLAAGRDIAFRLPFLDQTKAQVVRCMAGDRDLEDLARFTTSCVHYPLREKLYKQCGFCPACVFRRQAMAVAGIAERADSYKYDLFDAGQLREMEEKRLRFLVAFLLQAERLTQLDRPGAPPDFFAHHLRETEVVRQGEDVGPYVELYRSYRDEWLGLAGRCLNLGFPWAVPVARRKAGVA